MTIIELCTSDIFYNFMMFLSIRDVAFLMLSSNPEINKCIKDILAMKVHEEKIKFPDWWNRRTGCFNTNRDLTVKSMCNWLITNHVKTTHMHVENVESIKNYAMVCGSEFRSLIFSYEVTQFMTVDIIRGSPKITSITLYEYLTDYTLENIVQLLPNLEELFFTRSEVTNWYKMSELKQLRRFEIPPSLCINSTEITHIVNNCKKLEFIGISMPISVDFRCFLNCKCIKEIYIGIDRKFMETLQTLEEFLKCIVKLDIKVKVHLTMLNPVFRDDYDLEERFANLATIHNEMDYDDEIDDHYQKITIFRE
jgi:hypothetical protein